MTRTHIHGSICTNRRRLPRLQGQVCNDLLVGRKPIATWRQSQNAYDWLGSGIYFWEHSPTRALHWAEEQFRGRASVVGAVIQLGYCFDLLNEEFPPLLGKSFQKIDSSYRSSGKQLPQNHGREKKLRALDCAVINDCISNLRVWGGNSTPFAAPFSKENLPSPAQPSPRRLTFRLPFEISIVFWASFGQT